MTHYLGIRDPGRSGGSWVMYLCNIHPAGMIILGEPHLSIELDFPWPGTGAQAYDQKIIDFMISQTQQGRAVAGIVKCFRPWCTEWIVQNGGRIIALVRNPMEVLGSNMNKKPGSDVQFLGHKARDANEQFQAHAMYYRTAYEEIWSHRRNEPVTRIEDYNRSCGGDGRWLKAVMEWATQTPWPDGYIEHICKTYLPGYFYGMECVKQNGIVVGTKGDPIAYEPWRMNWYDDPRASEYWAGWSEMERRIFREILGPICDNLGYNCRDYPGQVDVDWPLKDQYAWRGIPLSSIPYQGEVVIRGSYPHGKVGLPRWDPTCPN